MGFRNTLAVYSEKKNPSHIGNLMNSTLESIIDLINISHLYTSYERYLATHHNYPSEGKVKWFD